MHEIMHSMKAQNPAALLLYHLGIQHQLSLNLVLVCYNFDCLLLPIFQYQPSSKKIRCTVFTARYIKMTGQNIDKLQKGRWAVQREHAWTAACDKNIST